MDSKAKFDAAIEELERAIANQKAVGPRPLDETDAERMAQALGAVSEALEALRDEL